MIPHQKVKEIIDKHKCLEMELSSGEIDPKLYVKKSKEYEELKKELGEINKKLWKQISNF